MIKLEVKIFNTPQVKLKNKTVDFPLKKAEALFYYIFVKGSASRDEIAAILWPENDETKAKKNLRNAIYILNNLFPVKSFFTSARAQILSISKEIQIHSDLKDFLIDIPNSYQEYTGDFLLGFLVKDADNFSEWMRIKRENYRELFISKLFFNINKEKKSDNFKKVKELTNKIITTDKYDEKAYQTLLKIYLKEKNYNKAITLYKKLVSLLEKDLAIAPESKTQTLYKEILEHRKEGKLKDKKTLNQFFFGRNSEIKELSNNFENCISQKEFFSYGILGEAGIGKTRLKKEFLNQIDSTRIEIIQTICYQAESSYLFKPWNSILNQLKNIITKHSITISPDWENTIASFFPNFMFKPSLKMETPFGKNNILKSRVFENTIIELFLKVSRKIPLLLVFEDIHWIDKTSLLLLQSLILHADNNRILILTTCRDNYIKAVDKFFIDSIKYNKLKILNLNRFSKTEVDNFINLALPDLNIQSNIIDKLFKKTQGNTFFLIEYLKLLKDKKDIKSITPKIKDILKSRILEITDKGLKILNIISLFFDKVSLDTLQRIINKDEEETIEIIEELKSKNMIYESESKGKIFYQFIHNILREYIYNQQSLTKKRLLHNKIGKIYEDLLSQSQDNTFLFPILIYHFKNGNNLIKTLQYKIKSTNLYLKQTHELFPETLSLKDGNKNILISKEQAISKINTLERLFKKVRENLQKNQPLKKIEVQLNHMKGRFLIKEGEYKKGIDYIRKVIKEALKIKYYEFVVKGYFQIIFYSIQVYNPKLMADKLKSALKYAKITNNNRDIATLFRLKGLNQMMQGNYNEAQNLLKKSIVFFKELQKKDEHSLCIAAAYNYMGEIKRSNNQYHQALAYYIKAINLAKKKGTHSCLAVFYTNAGLTVYDNKDNKKALSYFKKALKIFNDYNVIWKRSIAEGYFAMLQTIGKNYSQALESLKNAEYFAKKINNPYELGLIFKIKGQIKKFINNQINVNHSINRYLNQSSYYYTQKSAELLKNIR